MTDSSSPGMGFLVLLCFGFFLSSWPNFFGVGHVLLDQNSYILTYSPIAIQTVSREPTLAELTCSLGKNLSFVCITYFIEI